MTETATGSSAAITWSFAFTFYGVTGQPLNMFGIADANCGYALVCSSGPSSGYLYLTGKLVSQGGGQTLTDRLGSVRSGGLAYYPWGEPMNSGATGGGFEFATYWRDMVGQDYADQRYYNSNAGRFYTPDPSGAAAVDLANPTSWNMYAYVNDDPANFNDPRGLFLPAESDDGSDEGETGLGGGDPFCFIFPTYPTCRPPPTATCTAWGAISRRPAPV